MEWYEYVKIVGDVPNAELMYVLQNYDIGREAVLDLASGSARGARHCRARGFKRVVTVDMHLGSLAYRAAGIEHYLALIQDFMPDPDAFDLVYVWDGLRYLTIPQILRVIRNSLIGLKRGGIFACNVDCLKEGERRQHSISSIFTEDTLMALMSGFEILELRELKVISNQTVGGQRRNEHDHHELLVVARKP